MRAKFGRDPTFVSKKWSFKFISKLSTAVYTPKERLHDTNEVAHCINNNVIVLNTEHGFIKNKNIASCSSKNSANCIHYWSYRDCQEKKTDFEIILPFRLLRDRCYRADCSTIIYKPMCETPASVLSPVDTTIRLN